jgi:hypothetical protein
MTPKQIAHGGLRAGLRQKLVLLAFQHLASFIAAVKPETQEALAGATAAFNFLRFPPSDLAIAAKLARCASIDVAIRRVSLVDMLLMLKVAIFILQPTLVWLRLLDATGADKLSLRRGASTGQKSVAGGFSDRWLAGAAFRPCRPAQIA